MGVHGLINGYSRLKSLLLPFALASQTLGWHTELGLAFGWDPRHQLSEDFLVIGIIGEVGVFFGIIAVVVELLGSIFVDDEAPVAGPGSMIAVVRGDDRRFVAFRRGILELRRQGNAVERFVLGQIT